MTMMMNYKRIAKALDEQSLPNDLIVEVFERLPVKSLMRFKCVSKYWCKQIKNPLFIKNHLLKQQGGSNVLLLWNYLHPLTGVFSFHDLESKKLDEISSKLVVPFTEDNTAYPRRHGCLLIQCNGLVFMFYWINMAVCNPVLREYKELPPPHQISDVLGCGFGYTSTGDYKVVLVRRFKHVPSDKSGTQFQVYNLSTNLWEIIDSDANVFPVPSHLPCSQIFFNGSILWQTLSYNSNPQCSILSFNLSTGNAGQLDYPDSLKKINRYTFNIYFMIINDCFSLVWFGPKSIAEIWVMKEYGVHESWTKQFVVGPYPGIRPLLLWKNEVWLLAKAKAKGKANTNQTFVSCALNEKKMKRFQFNGVEDGVQVLNYKESLISLDDIMKSVPMIKLD